MNGLTENSMWFLFGLLFVIALFLITFAVRNQRAKTEGERGLHPEAKHSGATVIKKSDKV